MLDDDLPQKMYMLKIEICVNPKFWDLNDIKEEFLKHLEQIHELKGIDIENLKQGDLTLFEGDYVGKVPKSLPRKVIIKKVKGSEIIDAAIVTLDNDFDIVIDGNDGETMDYIYQICKQGIKIDDEIYEGERLLQGIIMAFRKYKSSYIVVVKK